jgi:hypothetical protein
MLLRFCEPVISFSNTHPKEANQSMQGVPSRTVLEEVTFSSCLEECPEVKGAIWWPKHDHELSDTTRPSLMATEPRVMHDHRVRNKRLPSLMGTKPQGCGVMESRGILCIHVFIHQTHTATINLTI